MILLYAIRDTNLRHESSINESFTIRGFASHMLNERCGCNINLRVSVYIYIQYIYILIIYNCISLLISTRHLYFVFLSYCISNPTTNNINEQRCFGESRVYPEQIFLLCILESDNDRSQLTQTID